MLEGCRAGYERFSHSTKLLLTLVAVGLGALVWALYFGRFSQHTSHHRPFTRAQLAAADYSRPTSLGLQPAM